MSTDVCRSPAAPLFERALWASHPNYPRQLLLLRSHQSFRSISRMLVIRSAALEGLPSVRWRDDTLYLFSAWQAGMKSHEHYEEHKLYPFLSQRYCVALDVLLGDHRELDRLRTETTETLVHGEAPAVQAVLGELDHVLVHHLQREEDLVIPMLLELEPEEFERYTRAPAGHVEPQPCRRCA